MIDYIRSLRAPTLTISPATITSSEKTISDVTVSLNGTSASTNIRIKTYGHMQQISIDGFQLNIADAREATSGSFSTVGTGLVGNPCTGFGIYDNINWKALAASVFFDTVDSSNMRLRWVWSNPASRRLEQFPPVVFWYDTRFAS